MKRGITDEDKWFILWRHLFVGHAPPRSPYLLDAHKENQQSARQNGEDALNEMIEALRGGASSQHDEDFQAFRHAMAPPYPSFASVMSRIFFQDREGCHRFRSPTDGKGNILVPQGAPEPSGATNETSQSQHAPLANQNLINPDQFVPWHQSTPLDYPNLDFSPGQALLSNVSPVPPSPLTESIPWRQIGLLNNNPAHDTPSGQALLPDWHDPLADSPPTAQSHPMLQPLMIGHPAPANGVHSMEQVFPQDQPYRSEPQLEQAMDPPSDPGPSTRTGEDMIDTGESLFSDDLFWRTQDY
jgi:hypothetical protein